MQTTIDIHSRSNKDNKNLHNVHLHDINFPDIQETFAYVYLNINWATVSQTFEKLTNKKVLRLENFYVQKQIKYISPFFASLNKNIPNDHFCDNLFAINYRHIKVSETMKRNNTRSRSFWSLYRLSLIDKRKSSTFFRSTTKSRTYSVPIRLWWAIQMASPTGSLLTWEDDQR